MAKSSRQSALFGVNDWQAIYQTFREADFRSYDYETLRKSFIDYLRLYYPETFNDYIESSEFIALLDVMAFMGQGLAFRNDLNARENFLDTAERRDSVIKLANLVSYTPKRNLTGQGYLKVTSVRTTENVIDLNGINLSNSTILWNDAANPNWQEQFNAIINATLINPQRVGRPGNSAEILGVNTQEYAISIPATSLPVVPFSSTVDGIAMPFELVSVTSLNEDYIYEIPPAPTGRFNILYRNDQLGFGSPVTGFFFYFKQGTLQAVDFNFEQQISNQVANIDIQGINNTDTWLYQLNVNNNSRLLWKQVENVYANAYLQTENSVRNIFSVDSRFNDQVSYVFGDGVFSEIPVGQFRAYVRNGNALTYTIDPSEMQGISVTFTYISRSGRNENITFVMELPLAVSTAQARESLAEIKQRAPTRYYTQNRMVNGEDYNNFPFTLYNSIIKSKAINLSSIGVSKNLDLLDPTGKYSSINTFGTDGALYQDDADGYFVRSFIDTSAIRAFIVELASTLGTNNPVQYYIQNYTRYDINTASLDGTVYWNNSTVNSNSDTGYFYTLSGTTQVPASINTYASYNLKYVTIGALVRFVAPAGYYFTNQYRLVSGIPPANAITEFWTTILNVIGDGTNNGDGNFVNGSGPVTVNGYVPTGAIINQVIPVFDNTFSTNLINEITIKMELAQDFTLVFDNSLLVTQERWIVDDIDATNWFVTFYSLGNNIYRVTYKSLAYLFGSVSQTRFVYSENELVYDPFSGKVLQDNVEILSINTLPNSTTSLGINYKVNVVGQQVESDGYVNNFEIEVSSTDENNKQIIVNPDFFTDITGYVTGASNIGIYAFFETIQDPVNLSKLQLIPTIDVAYQYATKAQVEVVKYDYPLGQLFYAYSDNKFYKTVQDTTVVTPYYILVEQTNYSVKPGRQGLSYQYRHNSNNTTRIDPSTTNIIDLYVVTQAYYTAYTNYIQDSTNTIPEPNMPTINELQSAYGQLNDYKMLSDSVVINSVVFKPLFGQKAAPTLRATIKVIKDSTTNASDSEIRSAVLTAMNNYFSINNWNFGDTFYFSELSAYLHNECGDLISSAVLVPNDPSMSFGDLYEIKCQPYEIFVNAATANDVQVIPALTPNQLQIR